jgi:hypothetical protein
VSSDGKRAQARVTFGAILELKLTPFPPQARWSGQLLHRDGNLSGDEKPLGVADDVRSRQKSGTSQPGQLPDFGEVMRVAPARPQTVHRPPRGICRCPEMTG